MTGKRVWWALQHKSGKFEYDPHTEAPRLSKTKPSERTDWFAVKVELTDWGRPPFNYGPRIKKD